MYIERGCILTFIHAHWLCDWLWGLQKRLGKKVIFVTNNSSKAQAAFKSKFDKFGNLGLGVIVTVFPSPNSCAMRFSMCRCARASWD